jgi:hypothetical protein
MMRNPPFMAGFLSVLLVPVALKSQSGFFESFNGKTKAVLQSEGWDFFPNAGFSISVNQPYDAEYIRANAGEGNDEFLATPCIEFDADLDTLTFYYRSYGTTQGYFTVGWQSAYDPLGINVLWIDSVPVVTSWTLLTAYYDPPDLPDVGRIIFGFGTLTSGSGGKLGIDHFQSEQASASYDCSELLPLSLTELHGDLVNGVIQLYWQGTDLMNVAEYVVERSLDAQAFERAGSVLVSQASDQLMEYRFTDPFVGSPQVYYRLCMILKDGSRTYSNIIPIETRLSTEVVLYPNPVENCRVSVMVPGASQDYQLRAYSLRGKLIEMEHSISTTHSSLIELTLPEDLGTELFLLEVCNSTGCTIRRVSAAGCH